jgi:glycosyltransferase involved in cell wall biosynthesis
VCPTFNSQEFIERTLNSVFSQTIPVDEIIVSDDGSTDNTLNTVRRIFSEYSGSSKCRLLINSHNGPGATRNKGILDVNSSWVAFIDSDDTWEENKVEEVLQVIGNNSDVNFICHNEYRVDLNKKKSVIDCSSRYSSSKSIINQLYWSNLFSTSAVVCKHSLLIDKGLFDENLMSIQDYELWLRLSPFINVLFINKTLGTYIERRGNITSNNTIKRFVNEAIVLLRHRNLVSIILVLIRIPKLILSHIYHLFRKLT